MSKKCIMKKRIQALDFAIYETVLFLDTHPTDRRALAALNDYKKRRNDAINEYESEFGPYVTTVEQAAAAGMNKWVWINGPWPWEEKGGE